MPDSIQCAIHGESRKTFACTHLLGETAGLGFNRDDPTDDNPFPDAWCDNCELIRASHNGWNDESQELAKISLLCSGCYERALIRNTRTSVTLGDLAELRWKCGSCAEWHTGPCLDFSYDSPHYWSEEHEKTRRSASLLPVQGSGWFLWLQLVPAVVLGGLWSWDSRRRYRALHPEIVLKRRARRGLRRQLKLARRAAAAGDAAGFASRAANALREACAPHSAANPSALVCADVLRELPSADGKNSASEIVRRLFAAADSLRFGGLEPAGAGRDLLALRPDLERLLEKMNERL